MILLILKTFSHAKRHHTNLIAVWFLFVSKFNCVLDRSNSLLTFRCQYYYYIHYNFFKICLTIIHNDHSSKNHIYIALARARTHVYVILFIFLLTLVDRTSQLVLWMLYLVCFAYVCFWVRLCFSFVFVLPRLSTWFKKNFKL